MASTLAGRFLIGRLASRSSELRIHECLIVYEYHAISAVSLMSKYHDSAEILARVEVRIAGIYLIESIGLGN